MAVLMELRLELALDLPLDLPLVLLKALHLGQLMVQP